VILLGISALASASQLVRFAADRATVPLPESFRVEVSGNDVVATFGAELDHKMELSLLAVIPNKGGARNLALTFIKEQGQKKGAKVHTDGKRAVFSEVGEQQEHGGKTFQSMHWQIGVGSCVFTMTLTAPLPMSKQLDEFLGEPLNTLVNEISCEAQ